MRLGMRRFTRLTHGFSKKLENLFHSVALNFMYYNFVRRHQTLRLTETLPNLGIRRPPIPCSNSVLGHFGPSTTDL